MNMGAGVGEPAQSGNNEIDVRREGTQRMYASTHATTPPPVDDTKGKQLDVGGALHKVGLKPKEKRGGMGAREWNTSNLGRRLATDALCALTAGGLVAPLITIVDKSVFQPICSRQLR